MHTKGSDEFSSNKSFRWPICEDRCFFLFEHILCIMNILKHTLVVSIAFLRKIFHVQVNCLK